MTCASAPATVEGAYQLAGWILTSLMIYSFGMYTFWNARWHAFLQGKIVVMPSAQFLYFLLTLLATANGWSAWRLWACKNWNVDPTPLFIFLLLIVTMALFWPTFHMANSPFAAMTVGIVAACLAITYTVFSGVRSDTWVVIVGVVDLLVTFTYVFFPLYLWALRPIEGYITVYAEYDGTKSSSSYKALRTAPFADSATRAASSSTSTTPASVKSNLKWARG